MSRHNGNYRMIAFYWYVLCIGILLSWHAYDVMFLGCQANFGMQKNYATGTFGLYLLCFVLFFFCLYITYLHPFNRKIKRRYFESGFGFARMNFNGTCTKSFFLKNIIFKIKLLKVQLMTNRFTPSSPKINIPIIVLNYMYMYTWTSPPCIFNSSGNYLKYCDTDLVLSYWSLISSWKCIYGNDLSEIQKQKTLSVLWKKWESEKTLLCVPKIKQSLTHNDATTLMANYLSNI